MDRKKGLHTYDTTGLRPDDGTDPSYNTGLYKWYGVCIHSAILPDNGGSPCHVIGLSPIGERTEELSGNEGVVAWGSATTAPAAPAFSKWIPCAWSSRRLGKLLPQAWERYLFLLYRNPFRCSTCTKRQRSQPALCIMCFHLHSPLYPTYMAGVGRVNRGSYTTIDQSI